MKSKTKQKTMPIAEYIPQSRGRREQEIKAFVTVDHSMSLFPSKGQEPLLAKLETLPHDAKGQRSYNQNKWPQEVAHSQNAAELWLGPAKLDSGYFAVSSCLASRIKFLKRRASWSLRGYIVITDTWCTSHVPRVSLGFYFIPLAHPTSWNEEGHSMTVQKGCRDFELPWTVTFFLCFSVSCFSVHYWLFPHAFVMEPSACL